MKFDDLSKKVIGSALEVHKELGPGLLESVYQKCLAFELREAGIRFEMEKEIPILYKGLDISCNYKIDLLIENRLIVELKSVGELLPIHEAQLLTYMKLAKIKTGLLINFNETLLKNGIKRFVF
ncbi:MAG: GxxExxY protein [Candidatus Aminicenantes bacterium]|nr:GxxExxY protein [Candidatus Aminicenantes bacterium]NIQ66031.1 GxxExxY protein [Candidatus Aminicenantes bacterium]NIT22024.1 GxxExxY protein [Candidatus Aminicenantes bacterium]